MTKKWEPEGGIEEFRERCIEIRSKGGTWSKIAGKEGISRRTLYWFFTDHKDFQSSVEKIAKPAIIDNLRSTGIEMAIIERNPTMIIYLLKAMGKMYDTPKAAAEEPASEESTKVPGMTRAEAKKILASKKAK